MLLNFHRQDLWLSQIVDVQGKERRKQGVIQEINVCIHRKAREELTSPSATCHLKCIPWPTKPCKPFIHLCEPGVFSKKNPPQKCHPLAEAKPTHVADTPGAHPEHPHTPRSSRLLPAFIEETISHPSTAQMEQQSLSKGLMKLNLNGLQRARLQ